MQCVLNPIIYLKMSLIDRPLATILELRWLLEEELENWERVDSLLIYLKEKMSICEFETISLNDKN